MRIYCILNIFKQQSFVTARHAPNPTSHVLEDERGRLGIEDKRRNYPYNQTDDWKNLEPCG
ncbi:MAG: hypothetical protein C4332_00525 [Meiothermus sp.]